MKQIRLDAKQLERKAEAHQYLKEMLELPDYYGMNLDALYDCLTEMGETEILFENTEEADHYFEKILRVFKAAEEENEELNLQFPIS